MMLIYSFTPFSQLKIVVNDISCEDSMDGHISNIKQRGRRRNRAESDSFRKRILRVRQGKLGQRVVTFSRRKSLLIGPEKTGDINDDTHPSESHMNGIGIGIGIEEKKAGIPLLSPLSPLSGTEGSHRSHHSQHCEYMMELQKLLEDEKSKLDAQRLRMENLLNKMQDQHKEDHIKLQKQKDELNDIKKKYETMIEEKEAEYKQRFDELEKKEKEFEEKHATLLRNVSSKIIDSCGIYPIFFCQHLR